MIFMDVTTWSSLFHSFYNKIDSNNLTSKFSRRKYCVLNLSTPTRNTFFFDPSVLVYCPQIDAHIHFHLQFQYQNVQQFYLMAVLKITLSTTSWLSPTPSCATPPHPPNTQTQTLNESDDNFIHSNPSPEVERFPLKNRHN